MDKVIEQLEGMNRQESKVSWAERFSGEAPNSRATDLLRRQIAWGLQEEQFGGLSIETKRRLRDLANGFEKDTQHTPASRPKMQTGTILTREWKGG